MNYKKRRLILVLVFFTWAVFSQSKLTGKVVSKLGKPLAGVSVMNVSNGITKITNENGTFEVELDDTKENYFNFYKDDYQFEERKIAPKNQTITIVLSRIQNLKEVLVTQHKDKATVVGNLKDVEGTAIYAGKKSEVITLDKITANKAVNNSRQVFSQVAGLTMNESSDGGLQLSIGGRGLNPNRTSNFNTRQNDYDISADVLGYPESYYATPTEALEQIYVIRGAASLQYGTQFGGLINFKTKTPSTKPIELSTRNTIGAYNLYANYTSLSGTFKKFSYYAFYNHKQGDGFRSNSEFNSNNYFVNFNYQLTNQTQLQLDYTYFNYLAKQAGGLTDLMFLKDHTQSNRTRNWFTVNWNLVAFKLKHHFNKDTDLSMQLFGLGASRGAVGYRTNKVSNADVLGTERDLIVNHFNNWGAETRFLHKYTLKENHNTFVIGAKYYQSNNDGLQGPGSSKSDADFDVATEEFPFYNNQSYFKFPNLNFSVFGENIFKITPKFLITPGFRYEYIKTEALGYYRKINRDLAGNVILDELIDENQIKNRDFFLMGLGLSYKMKRNIEWYGNVSQNYRSVTFNDIRIVSPSQVVANDIHDEKGYTTDLGLRGHLDNKLTFDTSLFSLYYKDKIGEYETKNPNGAAAIVRLRDNIGTAVTYGLESILDWNIYNTFFKENANYKWNLFTNIAITDSKYLQSDAPNVEGNKVEFVPFYNIKSGMGFGYKKLKTSIQLTQVSSQFTDANNSVTNVKDNVYGIFGEIPAYYVADFSASYGYKKMMIETGITNFTDSKYFTRRATGYPGPGIIPSDGRMFYVTLELNF